MASLRIPNKHLKGFEQFLCFSEDDFNIFMSGVVDSPITLDTKEVITKAISETKEIPIDEVNDMAEAILSLSLAKAVTDTDSEEFAEDLVQAIEENPDIVSVLDVGAETIKTRLKTLFDLARLSIATKASSLMYEYENVYYNSRAISDIRPVFSTDIDKVEAALVIHNLRIHYHVGEAHKDFYVALDTADLQQLIDVLERAKTKAEKLQAVLSASEIPYLDSIQK